MRIVGSMVPSTQADTDNFVQDGNVVHWALPPSLGLSPKHKKSAAVVLVIFMVGVAGVGTYLQILTSVNMSWDCAAVGD
jgi:hypothetical protein